MWPDLRADQTAGTVVRALLVAAAALALTGCSTPVPPAGDVSAASAPAAPEPVAVSIPAIAATSDLVGLGLDDDGRLVVPPVDQPEQAAWFAPGVRPGDDGPAVIYGHVNGRVAGVSTPGVFARLHDLAPGALVDIARADGSTVTFTVAEVRRFGKDEFPTAAVYGDTPGPELRLITCGGDFDPSTRHYRDNVVVFATLAGSP